MDTAGCGDVFHGAYIPGLTFGADIVERLELASAAAALYASRSGGNSIPRRHEVARFLKATGSRSAVLIDERLSH